MIENSFLLKNWEYFIPILILIVTLARIYLRGGDEKKSQPAKREKYQAQNRTKLADEEYIGDFQPDEYEDDSFRPALEDIDHVPFPGARVTLEGGVDRFLQVAKDRRSIRSFSSRPVDFKIIEKCIEAAGTAPSGAHTEPWSFCVVQDKELKTQIREIVEAEEYENYEQRMSRRWVTDLKPIGTTWVKEYLTLAPYLILVFRQSYGFLPNGKKKQHYYNEISVSISIGILLSAIQCAGLSSLVTTPLNCGPALKELLNRPANEKLILLLPVGYASDDCTVPDLKRKPVGEILFQY